MTTNAISTDTLIKVSGLQKHFKGGEIKALDGIDAEVRRGEVVVVIGPSGSGKSMFLRCLNLLEVPTGSCSKGLTLPIPKPISTCTGGRWAWYSSFSISFPI